MKKNTLNRSWMMLTMGVPLLWALAALVLLPALIKIGYHEKGFRFVNEMFSGREQHPLSTYLDAGWALSKRMLFLMGGALAAFFGLLWVFSREVFFRRFVGEARPESLALIRIWTCAILLISACWEHLPSSAMLPREMMIPHGVMFWVHRLVPGFDAFAANPVALSIFQNITCLLLVLAMVGFMSRVSLPLAAMCYLLLAGLLRESSHFFHSGIVPLYLLILLNALPCTDAWALDNWLFRRRVRRDGKVYGWGRYACWSVIAVTYLTAGLSKLRWGGFFWWNPLNFQEILYRDSLSPMEFDFGISLKLLHMPDAFFAAMGIAGMYGEILFILVLFYGWARLFFPLLMAGMHLGIWLLQNVLFFDLMMLLMIFPMDVALNHFFKRESPGVEPASPGTAFGHPAPAALAAAVCVVLMGCWVFRVEYFPFTSNQMYAVDNSTKGTVNYLRLLAHFDDGRTEVARPENLFPVLRDTRYRALLARCLKDEQHRTVCDSFLTAFGSAHNRTSSDGTKIVRLEVQEREWNFLADPESATYGKPVKRLMCDVTGTTQ